MEQELVVLIFIESFFTAWWSLITGAMRAELEQKKSEWVQRKLRAELTSGNEMKWQMEDEEARNNRRRGEGRDMGVRSIERRVLDGPRDISSYDRIDEAKQRPVFSQVLDASIRCAWRIETRHRKYRMAQVRRFDFIQMLGAYRQMYPMKCSHIPFNDFMFHIQKNAAEELLRWMCWCETVALKNLNRRRLCTVQLWISVWWHCIMTGYLVMQWQANEHARREETSWNDW